MHDQRDRTSAYQHPTYLAPPIPYAESGSVRACPPSSSHMLFSPITGALIPVLQHHKISQQRLSTSTTNSATLLPLLPSSRRASSNHDCRNERDCANQCQSQCQEQSSLKVASLPPSFAMMTETWFGVVKTPRDAYLLFEACRVGKLHRLTRRLTDLERNQIIRPGAVFVWEEKEAGIKRWTDHVRWSPSRVSGAFLVYSELLSAGTGDPDCGHAPDPLLKQSFSSTTLDGDRVHLIAYYSKSALDSGELRTPTRDENLSSMVVPKGVYPDHRATGGVEDQVSRDRQRSSHLPHSSVDCLETSHSVPSSSSLDSATSSLGTHPLSPANLTTPGQVSYDRGVSHLHTTRSLSDSRDRNYFTYEHQPACFSSFYTQSLAPSDTERHALLPDLNQWDTFASNNINAWQTSPGKSTATSGTTSYPTVKTPPVSSLLASPPESVSVLGIWGDYQKREVEKEEPTSTTNSLATHPSNHYSYHPYTRIPDRERMSTDRCRKDKDSREFSYDPTPKTSLHGTYPLPSLQNKTNDGSPASSSNTTPSTFAGVDEMHPWLPRSPPFC